MTNSSAPQGALQASKQKLIPTKMLSSDNTVLVPTKLLSDEAISRQATKLLSDEAISSQPKKAKKNSTIEKRTAGEWLRYQFSVAGVTKCLFVLGIFGYIPGAWLYGFPLLLGYGILKRKHIKRTLEKLNKDYEQFSQSFWQKAGVHIGDAFSNHPISLVKAIGATLLLFSGLNLWNLMGVYGIYRFTNEEWSRSIISRFNDYRIMLNSFLSRTTTNVKTSASSAVMLVALGCAVWSMSSVGMMAMSLLSLGGMLLWTATLSVGFSAIWKDLMYAFSNPIKVYTQNAGKIHGTLLGRRLAHKIFSGTLEGTLGHAQGYVQSSESMLFLFPSNRFTIGTSALGIFFDNIRRAINGILSTFLLTSQVDTTGQFYGVIGPGPAKLFMMMVLGGMIGFAIEKVIDRFRETALQDVGFIKKTSTDKARKSADYLYGVKHHAVYLGVYTAGVMMTPAGAEFLALAQGSLATGIMMSVSFLAMYSALLYGASVVAKRAYQRYYSQQHAPNAEQGVAARPVQGQPRAGAERAANAPAASPNTSASAVASLREQPQAKPIVRAFEKQAKARVQDNAEQKSPVSLPKTKLR